MQMSAAMTLRAPLAARLRRSNAAGSRRGARSRCAMPPRAAADEPTQPIGLAAELTDTSRLGQRGELLVVAQFASLAGVFAPPPPLDALSGALGTAAALGGVAVALAGAQGLGASLSPFPAPMRGNVLVTDGIYAQTRNPMYAGLLLASFGVALASASPARALFTALLAAVLGAKMDTEEAALREQHGWAFEEYAARVPRLLPALPAVTPLLAAALNSLSSWAAAAALELKAGAPKSAKLFVGGVSFSTTEETLAAHFAGYGNLTDCFLMADKATGRPRGFGFVTFADAEVAQRVAAETHVIDGRQVDVKMAVPKELAAPRAPVAAPAAASAPRSSKIFVGGLAPATTEEAFRAHFAPFGAITDAVVMVEPASRRPRGFGFVTFASDDAVDRVFAEGAVQELAGKRVEIKRAVPREELPPPARNGGAAGSSLSAASPASRAAGAAAARRAAAAAGEPDAFTALMAHHAAVGAMHPAAAAYTAQLQALMAAAGGPYGGPYGSPYGGEGDAAAAAHWAMAGLMGPGGLAGAPLSPPRHSGPFGWGPGSPPHGGPGGPGYEQAAAAQFAAAYAAAGLELPHGGYGYGAARLSPYAGGFVPNVHAAAQSASRAQYAQQTQQQHHQSVSAEAPTARDTAMMMAGAAAAAAAAAVAAASDEVPSYLEAGQRSRNGSSSSLQGRAGGGSAPGSRRVSIGSLTQRGGSNSSLTGAGDDSCAAGADDGPGGGFPGALTGLRTALLTAPGPYY